ncbi:aminoacyl-tRNA hydrolase [Candidatus Campbellbacteria bacterium CG11_big_fil_rev_8_21_14_0_20_44_21]|uniref:Peptidyl-tRNA hydrolase n=1 Tax=Candidatus Campbellbacteria bacterium CG22_combo_CG10-13_8_21_14_all_43_18 TaxID=1974530 RepID=A0A2H0DY57_9BACT|nr:MAG: aminoacyl-tRNA hydrolase [Candidatus Campbellbacteria bacterium CG22_combo_CG10-13_8_21_14_all_43_18]PIR24419.1 MAG: aminoacyl-tRNA hydrolase [Candidatus Campbellbacteria bacterium CG11_big_fil_rev_8_21_14_0_20_44_21]
MFLIAGLGNPGEKYEKSRHNVGWIVLDRFAKDFSFGAYVKSAKNMGELSESRIGKEKVVILRPHTMMNNSGKAVSTLIKSKKAAQNLVVIHDDLDMPLGKFKIVYNRGSGGHKGVRSVKKALGTNEFLRIKVGISPSTLSGKVKKPKGEKAVLNFIIGEFKEAERKKIKKVAKDISEALRSIILDGRELAQTDWN